MNCFNETYVKLKRIQKLKGIFVKEEDELLIKEALAGKEKAFKLLLNKHREAIYHLVLKIVHNPEEARDLVQETFMKAFGSLATYKSEYRFTTWLYRIAANSSIDHLRKKKVESLSLNHPLETEDGTVGIELPDWTYNPEVDLVSKQRVLSIDEAINSLPKKYREVIVYRHKQDKSYEQIAEILGIPVGTVKARIFRARELLKKKLKSLR